VLKHGALWSGKSDPRAAETPDETPNSLSGKSSMRTR